MPLQAKKIAKDWIDVADTARKLWKNLREAKCAVRVLKQNGEDLPEVTKRRINDYARERLGAGRHANWLMVYAAVSGRFQEGWIPESYYLEHVMPRINGLSHRLGRVQATNAVLLERDVLPDVIYVLNGRLLSCDLEALTAREALHRVQSSGPEVVFKSDGSAFGVGVRSFRTADLTSRELPQLGNGVIQKKVKSHSVFDRFGVRALATLRIGTILTGSNAPEVRNCYLKIGRAYQHHVVARDQVRIAVDWRTGELDSRCFLSDWRSLDRHPDTGFGFENLAVPAIEKAVQSVLKLHKRLPFPGYVSWDLAIDQVGEIKVLEWEGGVVSFAEAVQGPCFADTGWDFLHLPGAWHKDCTLRSGSMNRRDEQSHDCPNYLS